MNAGPDDRLAALRAELRDVLAEQDAITARIAEVSTTSSVNSAVAARNAHEGEDLPR
jgi:hypothetical protein